MVHIKIDFLSSIESQIVGVNAFFALLAESLFEIRTDNIRRVFLLFLGFFEAVHVVVK